MTSAPDPEVNFLRDLHHSSSVLSSVSEAPRSSASFLFASVLPVANTRAPSKTPIWIAIVPTPLAPAITSSVSPRFKFAFCNIDQAVSADRGKAAHSCQEIPAGRARSCASGTTTASAQVPSRVSPRIPYSEQSMSSPAAQRAQTPQERPGASTTSVSRWVSETPSPIASTIPAPSHPGINGSGNWCPETPFRTHRSRWLSAAAFSRTRTSPGPGSGISDCSSRR